ncbi:phytanoyl-CoA dioxygenase-like protein [Naegleria gruberi]|uniref:Phytanoyl-CoA dioxygenase-like protein n=1 Tax=Naegleria gruberi TaxID=5762 RepID=D2V1E7_NAEGR|nr:phytanoyl-CoA dioxygenase-like protein [Naegleria gruberi]EFC49153.1 phytanoyl-CoA dioxygenase-like protein [Naegleria gruberi]|eukprot:XP_002681897.1 phytanoyl-CoA dioxygenase-like protein [Naegleria gruberi strain NEG-M]
MISNSNNSSHCTINFTKTGKTFEMPKLNVPLVADQNDPTKMYCQSFTVDSDDQQVLQFFNTYGFVVFENVLNQEETQATVNDIFKILSDGTEGKFNPEDTSTWNCWPQNALEHFGNVSIPSIFSRQFFMNRQNENVVRAFSKVFQLPMTELIVSHDRASFYRPPTINPKWKTKSNVHLDLNPAEALDEPENATVSYNELNRLHYSSGKGHWITENNHVCSKRDGLQIQALINLNDNLKEDGGFVCVPGFHNHFREFFENSNLVNELGRGKPSFSFQKNDPVSGNIHQLAQRVPSKAGSIIIWNQLLPHGSTFMESTTTARFRSAMYLRMFPKSMLLRSGASKRRLNRREGLRKKIHNLYIKERVPLELTDLGRIVFDIEDDNSESVFDPIPPFANHLK